MILVCGGIADGVTELVCARLEERGLAHRLLDLGVYPRGYRVRWRWTAAGPVGDIRTSAWSLDLAEIEGVFPRFPGPDGRAPADDIQPAEASALHAEHDLGIGALLDALPCVVVNRTGDGCSNHSKPLQALMLREEGFRVPETLVTDDPDAAREFVERHSGEVIFKSLSGIRSIVQKVEREHLERLPLLRHGPAQFQERVVGEDIRVHTVGSAHFATRIRSDVVDYRYARKLGGRAALEPTEIAPALAEACFRITRRLGLEMAGIDLKQTADGRTYCFEVNPAPAFLFYERGGGQPISSALADLLGGRQTRDVAHGCAMAGT